MRGKAAKKIRRAMSALKIDIATKQGRKAYRNFKKQYTLACDREKHAIFAHIDFLIAQKATEKLHQKTKS